MVPLDCATLHFLWICLIQVTLRSTEMQRTVYTAQAVLSGLYPSEAASGRMRADLFFNTDGDWAGEYLSFNEVWLSPSNQFMSC